MALGATPADRPDAGLDPLGELHGLLLDVAGGGLPSRKAAVDYINARSALLASPIGEMLPGFLYQCGTIDRFKEFILLYDPDPGLRREFIERMIGRARALGRADPSPERPRTPTARSPIWDF